jgi:hypothetical protein
MRSLLQKEYFDHINPIIYVIYCINFKNSVTFYGIEPYNGY